MLTCLFTSLSSYSQTGSVQQTTYCSTGTLSSSGGGDNPSYSSTTCWTELNSIPLAYKGEISFEGGGSSNTEPVVPGCEVSGTSDRIDTAEVMFMAEHAAAVAGGAFKLALWTIANAAGNTYTATLGSGRTSDFRIGGAYMSEPLTAEISCK